MTTLPASCHASFHVPGGGRLPLMRSHFAPHRTEADARRITDPSTVRELSRLDDRELRDIGVYRRACGTKWRLMGREATPPADLVFEYFRIEP